MLKRVLALQPANTDALVPLGFIELGINDPPAARSAFLQALSIAPAYTDATFGLASEFRAGNLPKPAYLHAIVRQGSTQLRGRFTSTHSHVSVPSDCFGKAIEAGKGSLA
ncbi:hypothetical protein EN904_04595 [Mesorhizobium sp. M7A.F.Ca.CA.001.07.2.1]|uniref:hypothetical protein n=1 Tax=Mesorhizobium TaxID=68287 RepID=UPI000FCAF19A|nr:MULTISPECIES: hypothetical protein [Mesorhizobium]RUY32629.1 hypothetical protein EN984_02105 [Mesorhizobium sp. M7A.F.Ca.CA.004.12.1.1]RUY83210.1 hypothetical protein EN964_27590 [Mesorhizobium sp. M7A.F.Ca.CA.001.10.2.1]RUZ57023.1 hypothetical protein EN956_06330 [Mesorhizobium sp. M7A.F.Ca.CA.004.05.2.1]MCF6125801.1 hypothetical protein [Mesorhizobium ciceri]MCQ8817985.1 hypothetical protein [Mesorhizobium sp. SEMIA396]